MSKCTHWVDKGVIECKQWADKWTKRCQDWTSQAREECDQWADEGYQACSSYEDHGYSTCSSWSKTCSDWLPWPLDYLCDAFDWVCKAWVWVSNWVCVAFVWIANWVCKAWVTIVEWVCVAWFWVIEAVCTLWSWVAKLFCIAWDTVRCLLVGVAKVLTVLVLSVTRRRRRNVRHVFVLMLENRSFDHMHGFSDITGIDAETGLPTRIRNFVGVVPLPTNVDPATGTPIPPSQPADFALTSDDKDPGHEFHDTLEQLAGTGAVYPTGGTPTYPLPNNSGFVANFQGRGSAAPEKAMHVYSPSQLPILNALAQEFAVCDNWF
ncbi:MAG: alkaline phosphatase family protein, partial [Tepidisphaeraceae bacterium]